MYLYRELLTVHVALIKYSCLKNFDKFNLNLNCTDPQVNKKSGKICLSADLALEYGFRDENGENHLLNCISFHVSFMTNIDAVHAVIAPLFAEVGHS